MYSIELILKEKLSNSPSSKQTTINYLDANYPFNPIPTGLGHVTLIYGLIPPMAGRNRVKPSEVVATFYIICNT